MSSIKSNCTPAGICADAPGSRALFEAADYSLSATLDSGQAFRWELRDGAWEGIIGGRWVRLALVSDRQGWGRLVPTFPGQPGSSGDEPSPPPDRERPLLNHDLTRLHGPGEQEQEQEHDHKIRPVFKPESLLLAETAEPVNDWGWLTDYLQLHIPLHAILAEFPTDEPMQAAVQACRGLRLLRQEPWECLGSFILSSTKQIVQIRQIVAQVCACFGEPIATPHGRPPARSFPTAAQLAATSEADLRACKMGFRAPYLRETAIAVARGEPDLASLANLETDVARAQLLRFPGVGRKIADCVLLFAYGRQDAFPVDVWVAKALRQLYFRGRRVDPKRLQRFAQTYFGRYAGYAQQYLFHYMRTRRLPLKS